MSIFSLHLLWRTDKRFWDHVSKRYDHQSKKRFMSYNKVVKHILTATSKESNVLEIGCGTGIITVSVAPYVNHITGIDISDRMLEIAQKKAKTLNLRNTTFLQSTVKNSNTKKHSYDTLLLINVLHLTENPEQILNEASQLLKPDGLIIATGDCFGEIHSFPQFLHVSFFQLISFLGFIPKIKRYTRVSFRQLFEQQGYTIYEEETLDNRPLNCYLEVRKN